MIEASAQPVTLPHRSRLLLIDDCISQRDLYECVLKAEFEVTTAARGDEGARLAISAPPDVVVLDVKMPGQDGWVTCRQLRDNPATADIPVILLTGVDDGGLEEEARRAGATALLRKPCSADRLSETIQSCLRRRRQQAVLASES
jgi:DNA-binding response OmpR family regulator